MSYDTLLAKSGERLLRVPWNCLVCDEAHAFKNRGTETHKAVRRGEVAELLAGGASPGREVRELAKRAAYRLAMTGTPVRNRAEDLLGIVAGFLLSRLFGFDLRQSQTIAIEVGMQNSGLAAALSLQFFSATASLPAALFSIWHNVSGALLAGYWGRRRDSLQYLLADIETIKSDGA